MPQMDDRRNRTVPIEYNPRETLDGLPFPDRHTLVLVSDGRANVLLNDRMFSLTASCVLCLSSADRLHVVESRQLYAQSFSLDAAFLKMRMTFRQMKEGWISVDEDGYSRDALALFTTRTNTYAGILRIPQQTFHKAFEWMAIIGSEIRAQSDGRWTCRIRSYFLNVLNLLDDARDKYASALEPMVSDVVDTTLEQIHTRYMENLTLDDLSRAAHVNRTTLNRRFRVFTGRTAIDYLGAYRLQAARELLAHTSLTLDEIAQQTGFRYGTYLIRRFTAWTGQSPTVYRREAREKYGITPQRN